MSSIDQTTLVWKGRFYVKRETNSISITGCLVLSSGQFLLADYHGKKQLMQYGEDGTHIMDIPLSGRPFGLTLIDLYNVGISYGAEHYIEVFNLYHKTARNKTKFDECCWDLCHSDNKIYTILDDKGIAVTDLSGNIVNIIRVNVVNVGDITTANGNIYYSNNATSIVYCRKPDGEKIWKFHDKSIVRPRMLSADASGNVFVIGANSLNVSIIAHDGSKCKTLLNSTNGLSFPSAIYYNDQQNVLLICNTVTMTIAEAYMYTVKRRSSL